MARKSREHNNAERRRRYEERTLEASKARGIRVLRVIGDRFSEGMSYRKIAKKHGLSVGGVQYILKQNQ